MTTEATSNQIIEAIYHRAATLGYCLDTYQRNAADRLGVLAEESLSSQSKQPKGVYLWGAVGRGKSFLLDTFFEAAPLPDDEKLRVHFHAFFRELHQRMFELTSTGTAIELALDQMIGKRRLLCFDEFHLHDIGDAMLISRLFKELLHRKMVILTTSNYAPDGLLPNPPYHERFLPTIALIKENMDVLSLAGEIDYRSSSSAEADPFYQGAYVTPGNEQQRQALDIPLRPDISQALSVGNRTIKVLSAEGNRLQISFNDICNAPTAPMDYLTLAGQYDCWILEDVPLMTEASLAAQQRFINLIDIMYEKRCLLFVISEYPFKEVLANADIEDMARTQSRLSQMRHVSVDDER